MKGPSLIGAIVSRDIISAPLNRPFIALFEQDPPISRTIVSWLGKISTTSVCCLILPSGRTAPTTQPFARVAERSLADAQHLRCHNLAQLTLILARSQIPKPHLSYAPVKWRSVHSCLSLEQF